MSDCVYWAFSSHLKYLGVEELSFSHELFRALRKPTLPERQENWGRAFWDKASGVFKQVDDDYSGDFFRGVKLMAYDFSYTHGSVAPLIIHTLAAYHGLQVNAQYDKDFGWETLHALSTTDIQKNVIANTRNLLGQEVSKITLEPAIYLHLDGSISHHAQFGVTAPARGIVAGAFQLVVPAPINY